MTGVRHSGPAGLDPQFAATLRQRAAALGRERFAVTLPCMLCRQPQPVDVQVGGLDGQQDATPGNVVCGACNAQVEADVKAAMTQARDGR